MRLYIFDVSFISRTCIGHQKLPRGSDFMKT